MKSRDRSWLSVTALLVFLSIIVSGYEHRLTTNGDSPLAETMESATSQDPFPWSNPSSVGLNPDALEQLSTAVYGHFDAGDIVGAELLVIKDRRTVLHRAYGWKDRESEIPMELNTIFNIRSMTKPLTGAAAQILIEEGRLGLDDPVASYLEGFEDGAAQDITIEQLLTHRAGLPLSILSSIDEYADLVSMANAVGRHGTEFTPGTIFYYSDAGSDVLGAVIEQVTQDTLDGFISKRLLEPLGMEDSFYYVRANSADPRSHRVAPLYVSQGSEFAKFWIPEQPLYPFAWGSQTLYSTPKDYARFLAMWLDQGVWEDDVILTKSAVKRILTPASSMTVMGGGMESPTGFHGLEMHYGQMSVLYLAEDNSTAVIGHSGSDGTLAWAWPDRDLMILLFTQSRGSSFWLSLESSIDRILLHPEITQLNEDAEERHAHLLGQYVPEPESLPVTATEIVIFNGELALAVPGGMIFVLKEIALPLQWRFDLLPDHRVTFFEQADGTIDSFQFTSPGERERYVRGIPRAPEAYQLHEVEHLLGTYLDEEAEREIEVVFESGKLAVIIPESLVPFLLLPENEDGWMQMALNPTVAIRFDFDTQGQVISFTALSPEGEAVCPRVDASSDPQLGEETDESQSP